MPLSPFVEFLIARLGRDDLDLDRRRPESTEVEAPATGLVDDLRTVRRDVAQGVDLVVVFAVGKGAISASKVSSARPGIAFGRRTKPS